MASVTIPDLVEAGIHSFAWINPGEDPGGVKLSRPLPHGAFLYRRKKADGKEQAFFYVIRRGNEAGRASKWTPAEAQITQLAFGGLWATGDVPDSGVIQAAFGKMISAFASAKEEKRDLEEDLNLWRETAAARWVRSYGMLLPAYYLLGLVVYGLVEGWSALDTCYYLTTTVTTVGYGDFCPGTALGRWFTALYAPLGTITVMTALLPHVEWTLLQLDELTAWPVAKAEDWLTRAFTTRWGLVRHTFRDGVMAQIAEGKSASFQAKSRREMLRLERRHALYGTHAPHVVELTVLGGSTVQVSGAWAMVHALLGPLLLGGVGVLLSLWVHQYVLCDAVYWTVITMTTVGYGDLLPETNVQKLYTMMFMPLAATTLAATVERFEKLRTARRIHDTNFQLVADTMLREEAVIQQTVLPELSESAFILRVLVEENMVEEQTLAVLKGRYSAMLARGAGLMNGKASVDEDGMPKTIDAELIFHLLVQQHRIVDRNLLDAKQRQAAQDAEAGMVGSGQRKAMAQMRGREGGLGRGQSRGALDNRDSDVTTAVDMSAADGGFREWHEGVWIPSLEASGVEKSLVDHVQAATRAAHESAQRSVPGEPMDGGAAGSSANASRRLCSFCESSPCVDGCPHAPDGKLGPSPRRLSPRRPSPRRSDGYARLDDMEMPDLSGAKANAPSSAAARPEQGSLANASSLAAASLEQVALVNASNMAPAPAPPNRERPVPTLGIAAKSSVPPLVMVPSLAATATAYATRSESAPGAQHSQDDIDLADPSLLDA